MPLNLTRMTEFDVSLAIQNALSIEASEAIPAAECVLAILRDAQKRQTRAPVAASALTGTVLKDCLLAIKGAIYARTSMPILTHVLISYDCTFLTLTTTDLEKRYTIELPISLPCITFSALVPFKELYAIVSKARKASISFDVADTHFSALANGEPLFTSPLSMSLDEFPLDLSCGDLAYARAFNLSWFSAATPFTSNDDSHEVLHNVLIAPDKIGSADGFRLFIDNCETGAGRNYLLPAVLIEDAKYIVSESAYAFYTDLSDADWFYPTITGTTKHGATLRLCHASLLMDKYPDIQRIVPPDFNASFAFDASAALVAIDRVMPVAQQVLNIVTIRPQLSGPVFLDASYDSNAASAPIEVRWSRHPDELASGNLGINIHFLREAIVALADLGADEILFSYNSPVLPFVLSASDRSSAVTARIVVMPMHLAKGA